MLALFLTLVRSPDTTDVPVPNAEPTKTPNVIYVYVPPADHDTELIVAIVILAIAIVAIIILIIVACVKRRKGEIYANPNGSKTPQMEAGTVEVRSIYSLKSTQKQYVTTKY